MNTEKMYSLLGFAARMGKLSYGKERIRAYMRSKRRRKIVVIAEDASDRLRFDLLIRSEKTRTRIITAFRKSDLGRLLGKREISAVAVEDDDIIDGIERYSGG